MSYRLEGKDIVISGFEQGIAESPFQGISDIRNMQLVSIPGEADVNYKTQALTQPPALSALAFTALNAGDVFTVASTAGWYAGMAIVLNTWSGTGPSTGVVYYVGNIIGNTFQIFESVFFAFFNIFPIAVTGNGSGTLSSYTMARPIDKCQDNGEMFSTSSNGGVRWRASYIVDSRNQVWLITPPTGLSSFPPNTVIFLGNIGSTISGGPSSIAVWSGFLFLFRLGATDIFEIDNQDAPSTLWTYGWNGVVTSGTLSRKCLVGQDDAIYICNDNAVASLLEVAGQDFDPTDSATYDGNSTALLLPEGEVATCLAELGTNLLVGGTRYFIYPWDRVSTSYNYPIVVPEAFIAMILATNSNAYIFAGNRGYVYITNGSNVDEYMKIPDHLTAAVQPYFLFGGSGSVASSVSSGGMPNGDGIYWRNQLYFTMIVRTNANAEIATLNGVWAIDLTTKALRLVNKLSFDTYAGRTTVVVPMSAPFLAGGEGYYAGWVDGSSNIGVDGTISTPYTNFEAYMELDMIPVGTYLDPFTPSQIEWKAARPLVSGEAVRLSYRLNLTDSFTVIDDDGHTNGICDTVGSVSDVLQVNFQKAQWVQLKIETRSTASTPSQVPLTEVRIRDWPSGKNARG